MFGKIKKVEPDPVYAAGFSDGDDAATVRIVAKIRERSAEMYAAYDEWAPPYSTENEKRIYAADTLDALAKEIEETG